MSLGNDWWRTEIGWGLSLSLWRSSSEKWKLSRGSSPAWVGSNRSCVSSLKRTTNAVTALLTTGHISYVQVIRHFPRRVTAK